MQIDTHALNEPDAVYRGNYRSEVLVEYLTAAYDKYLQDENYDIEPERETMGDRFSSLSQGCRDDAMRNKEEVEKVKQEYEVLTKSKVSSLRM